MNKFQFRLIATAFAGIIYAASVAQPTIITQNWIDPMCNGGANGSITIMATGTAPIQYSIDGGTTFVGDGLFVGLTAGTYTVIVEDGNGAQSTTTITLTEPPLIDIALDNLVDETCQGYDALIDVTIANAVSPYIISWSGPSGFIAVTEDISGLEAGIYTITVVDALGCSRSISVNVALVNTVTAGFTADVTSGMAPFTVNFTNTSVGAATYAWSFGDGNTSTASNPSNTYTIQGNYFAQLVAYQGVCSDTVSVLITVTGPAFEVPNVFSPNQDGINDVFAIIGNDLAAVDASIYNRYGELVYRWQGPKGGWDGRTAPAGMEVPSGTYYYFVTATDTNNITYEQNGAVTLMR